MAKLTTAKLDAMETSKKPRTIKPADFEGEFLKDGVTRAKPNGYKQCPHCNVFISGRGVAVCADKSDGGCGKPIPPKAKTGTKRTTTTASTGNPTAKQIDEAVGFAAEQGGVANVLDVLDAIDKRGDVEGLRDCLDRWQDALDLVGGDEAKAKKLIEKFC